MRRNIALGFGLFCGFLWVGCSIVSEPIPDAFEDITEGLACGETEAMPEGDTPWIQVGRRVGVGGGPDDFYPVYVPECSQVPITNCMPHRFGSIFIDLAFGAGGFNHEYPLEFRATLEQGGEVINTYTNQSPVPEGHVNWIMPPDGNRNEGLRVGSDGNYRDVIRFSFSEPTLLPEDLANRETVLRVRLIDELGGFDISDTMRFVPVVCDDYTLFDDVEAPDPMPGMEPEDEGEPVLGLSTTALDFGEVGNNIDAPLVVVLSNSGMGKAAIEDMRIEGSQEFSVTEPEHYPGTVDGQSTLLDGREVEIIVVYRPEDEGQDQATLVIESDDPEQPVLEVALAGSGAPDQ